MSWGDIWGSMEGFVGLGGEGDTVPAAQAGQAYSVGASDPAVSAGLSAADVSAIDGGAPVGASNDSWWEKPIQKMMPQIMGAAMKPQVAPHAGMAGGGHGVQANTSGLMKLPEEIGKAANNNPLSDLHQWAGLFG